MHLLLPSSNEVWDKVIFLHLSVILLTGGTGVQIYHFLSRPPPNSTIWTAPPSRQHQRGAFKGWCCSGTLVNKWPVRILLVCFLVWQIKFFWQFVENYCPNFKHKYIPRRESSVVRRRTTKQCKPHRKTIDSNKPGQTILRFWLFCCTFCSLFGFDISENIIRDTFSIQF